MLTWVLLAAAAAGWPLSRRPARLVALAGAGRLLGRPPPAARFVRLPAGVFIAAGCLALGGGTWLLRGRSAALTLALAALAPLAVLAHVMSGTLRDRVAARSRDNLHLALTVLCGELAAGSTQPAALDAAATAVPEYATELAALERSGAAAMTPLAAAWALAGETGAPLAEVLDRVRADVEGTRVQQRAVAAAAAAPLASAGLLALLPVVGVGLGAAIGAQPLAVLFGTAPGRVLLVVGAGLDALGVLWASTIVRRARP